MLNLSRAIEVMIAVAKGQRHANYERTVKLASEYVKFYTGEGISSLLRRVVPREDEKWFKQRVLLTQAVTVSMLSPLKLPFQKVCRTRPSVSATEWDEGTERKIVEVEAVTEAFRGEFTLKQFLEFTQVNFNFFDPNAWLVIDFDEFNPEVEKARPYPIIIPSSGALDFEYDKETLQYLVVDVNADLIGYFGEYAVTFRLMTLEEAQKIPMKEDALTEWNGETYYRNKDKSYVVDVAEPKASRPPCWRVGYLPDPLTMGKSFVGIFHDALPLLHKTIKINSEFDLALALVAHPKVISYQSPCSADGCKGGTLPDGATCSACEGTGIAKVGTSVQDAIVIELPRNTEDLIDLDKLLVYKSPPIDLLEFQGGYIEKLGKDIQATVFNTDVFDRQEVARTATENLQQRDNLDDTLYPFAQRFSYLYRAIVQQVAEFLDYGQGIRVQYEFPAQFNFKTVSQLLAELDASKKSGASPITISFLQEQINDLLLYDQPEELRRQRIRNRLSPWTGYSPEDIRIIASTYPLSDKVVAWAYGEAIWDELEADTPALWDMSFERIRDMFRAKVTEYAERIKAEKPAPVLPLSMFGDQEQEQQEEGGEG